MPRTDDPKNNIVDRKFGRLRVIEFAYTSESDHSMWRCKCECGNEVIASRCHLTSGHTKSCGCLKREKASISNKKHGKRNSRLYRIWLGMKQRCVNPNDDGFRNYGARGIVVCDEWKNDFQAFYDWSMENGYNPNAKRGECTLDRIDVNGNYDPSNCRWIPFNEQQLNKRTNKFITFNGETKTIKEWSVVTGLHYNTIYSRYKLGKSPNEILKGGEINA